MKRPILIALGALTGILLANGPAAAQPGYGYGPGDPGSCPVCLRMRQELGLSDEQAQALARIMQTQREQRRAARNQSYEQMQAIRGDTIEQLRSVLTETQLQRFQELHQPRMRRFNGRGAGKRGGRGRWSNGQPAP